MQYSYQTSGTCSREILFEIEDGKVRNLTFIGGCNGNLQGIGKLVEGMNVDEVIARVEGISCGGRPTSCPDQLARALKAAKEKEGLIFVNLLDFDQKWGHRRDAEAYGKGYKALGHRIHSVTEILVKGSPIVFCEQLVSLHHQHAVHIYVMAQKTVYVLFDMSAADASLLGCYSFKHLLCSFCNLLFTKKL